MDERDRYETLATLVRYLLEERHDTRSLPSDASFSELWDLFRALVNVREPHEASDEFLTSQDALLQELISSAGITQVSGLAPVASDTRLRLWRGDITTLAADAIVNAANSRMLGCWVPGHYCIDNAIHTYAGIQLRLACDQLMQVQGHEEPTGQAKITSAFNLPARYVIHTVGPIANGHPTNKHRRELALSYESCLDLAHEQGLSNLAFCCISTGVFGFPQEEAAHIAVRTVRNWLDTHPETPLTVIFNVFSAEDEAIYQRILDM